jgi:hypothetical protein
LGGDDHALRDIEAPRQSAKTIGGRALNPRHFVARPLRGRWASGRRGRRFR